MTQPGFYDPSGKPVSFENEDQAAAAIQSGQAGALKGSVVAIRSPDGKLLRGPAEDLPAALRAGAKLATSADLEEEARAAAEAEASQLREERRGTGLGRYEQAVNTLNAVTQLGMGGLGQILAGGAQARGAYAGLASAFGDTESVARSQGREDAMSLGIGKLARKYATEALYGKEAADKLVREAELTRALHPEAYTKGATEGGVEMAAGQAGLGGLAGVSRAGGLFGTIAKIGTAPATIPEAAGALAEAGLMKGGLSAGQTVLGNALRGGLAMGVRGGVESAIVGGASELTEEAFGDPSVVGEKVWLAAGKGALTGFGIGFATGAVTPILSSALRRGADKLPEAVNSRLRKLDDVADEQAFRQLSPHPARKFTAEAEARIPGGIKAVGKVARETGIVDTSSAAAAAGNTNAAMLGRASAVADELGTAIGERMRNSSATIAGHEIEAIAKKLLNSADETGLPISRQAGRGNVANTLRSYVDDLLEKGGMLDNEGKLVEQNSMSMADAFAQRRALDQKIYKDYSALEAKGPMELMRKFRGELDDLMMRKLEAAGESGSLGLGPTAGMPIRELKAQYQAVTTAKKILEDGAIKEAKNRAISLTDYISGASMAMGHPITGLAAAIGHKYLRERGNGVATWALSKLADLGGVAHAVNKSEHLLESAAAGAAGVRRTPYRTPAVPEGSLRARYEAAAQHTRELAVQADGVDKHVTSLARIQSAPRISDAYAAAMTRASAALIARLPPSPPQSVAMHQPRPRPEQMRDFLSAYDAAHDPESLLKEVGAGSLDPAKTSLLREVAPGAYADLRGRVQKHTLERIHEGDIPAQSDLMKLHLAFGITVDPTMTPQALFEQQQVMAGQMNGEGAQPEPATTGRRGRASSLKQQREPAGADRFER